MEYYFVHKIQLVRRKIMILFIGCYAILVRQIRVKIVILSCYVDVPILLENIDYAFTTPCCTCLKISHDRSRSHIFNDFTILANKLGQAVLFSFKSRTLIYDFGNIFQSHSVNFEVE